MLAVVNGLLCWIGTRLAAGSRAPTQAAGSMRGVRAFTFIKLGVLLLVLVDVLVLKWPLLVQETLGQHRWMIALDDLLLLTPALLMMATVMAFRYRLDRWEGTVSLDLGRYLWLRFRVETGIILAGWLLLVTVDDLAIAVFYRSPSVESVSLAATLGTFGVLVVVGPVFIKYLWKTSSLPDGPLRERLQTLCEAHRFRYRDILVWHTENHLPNAGVIGILPAFRHVLVTDALLARCSPEEVEAVFAHEIGHARYHHLGFYLLFALAFLCFYLNGADLLATLGLMAPVESVLALEASPSQALVMLCFAVVYWVFVFGFISRRLEQQADIFSLRASSDAGAFVSALRKLSSLSRVPRRAGSWRHFSIERRIRFLERAAEDPRVATRSMKWTFALQAAVVALFVLGLFRLAVCRPDLLWF